MEWHVFPRLIQQLEEPLGFGKDYEASVKEMTAFIGTFLVASWALIQFLDSEPG